MRAHIVITASNENAVAAGLRSMADAIDRTRAHNGCDQNMVGTIGYAGSWSITFQDRPNPDFGKNLLTQAADNAVAI